MDTEHPWRQLALAVLIAGIAVWAETPAWQRQIVTAAVKSRTRRVVAWMARRYGHAAMGDELAGRDDAAEAGYGLAYRLSQLRDRL
jgi:hypothetical protein